jgi:hypothetical protein
MYNDAPKWFKGYERYFSKGLYTRLKAEPSRWKDNWAIEHSSTSHERKIFSPMKYDARKMRGRFRSGMTVLTHKQWKNQIKLLPERIASRADSFISVMSYRAQTIFQNSFKQQRFYSSDGGIWKRLSPVTIAKRTKNGTWPGSILNETGDLLRSIKVSEPMQEGFIRNAKVYTDPKAFRSHKDGRMYFCYAGLHNNPSQTDTYGRIRTHIVQRQFMGHSTYYVEFENKIIDKYLFYDIFPKMMYKN